MGSKNSKQTHDNLYQVDVKSFDSMKKYRIDKCITCYKNIPDCAFIPCGHCCMCTNCMYLYKKKYQIRRVCPLCKQRYKFTQKIYMSGMYDLVDIEQVKMIMNDYHKQKDRIKELEETLKESFEINEENFEE